MMPPRCEPATPGLEGRPVLAMRTPRETNSSKVLRRQQATRAISLIWPIRGLPAWNPAGSPHSRRRPGRPGSMSISVHSIRDAIEEWCRASRAWPRLAIRPVRDAVRARQAPAVRIVQPQSTSGQLCFQCMILLAKKRDHITLLALEPSTQRREQHL